MEGKKLAGMALAATAAALFMTGCASMGGGGGTFAKAHCEGVNACKGQGFVSLTPVECRKVPGRA